MRTAPDGTGRPDDLPSGRSARRLVTAVVALGLLAAACTDGDSVAGDDESDTGVDQASDAVDTLTTAWSKLDSEGFGAATDASRPAAAALSAMIGENH